MFPGVLGTSLHLEKENLAQKCYSQAKTWLIYPNKELQISEWHEPL